MRELIFYQAFGFKEIQKSFDKLGAKLTIEEFSQKAVIKTPTNLAITLSDNLQDLLGSDTKTFQEGTITTMSKPCDI